jgi:NACHT domain
VDLAAAELASPLQRNKLLHAVTGIGNEVAEQVQALVDGAPANEVQAALDAVADTIEATDLSDDALFAADSDPEVIARRIRAATTEPAGLSEAASRLYGLALDQSCRYLVQVVLQLPAFQPRALAEVLGRLTSMSGQLAELLSRTPRTSLDAPRGTDHDDQFRHRYLDLVAKIHDKLELIGVSVRNFRPRTTLTVAYLGLTVDSAARSVNSRRFDMLTPDWFAGDKEPRQQGTVRVETALAAADRVLLRGEAGSGKSTLLSWIVVTAARHGFTGELAKWNGRIPFVVKLRSYAGKSLPLPEEFLFDSATPGTGPAPEGWIHRQLSSGNALLLVDGVDELAAKQRPQVRTWLERLLTSYPDVPVVVTSRPGAAGSKWLAAEKFTTVNLERMTPADVRTFLEKWHAALIHAAKDTDLLPFSASEVDRHRRELLSQLNTRSHLRALAGRGQMVIATA